MERRKMGDGRGGEGERKRGKEGILIERKEMEEEATEAREEGREEDL